MLGLLYTYCGFTLWIIYAESHSISSDTANVIQWELVGVTDNRERGKEARIIDKLERISIRSRTINIIGNRIN